jgi:hypothetical protein
LRRNLARDLVQGYERLAETLESLHQPDEALRSLCAASEVLERLPDRAPSDLEKLARMYSRASTLADPRFPDSTGIFPRVYADRALALVRRLIAEGHPNLLQWTTDPSLDALRARPDFKLMMMDLAMPAEAFAPIR